MTENEAIEKLKNMRLYMQITDKNNDCKFTEDDYKANEMAIQALEKQIPKRVIRPYKGNYKCPTCENYIYITDDDLYVYGIEPPKYCDECGQALDWSNN